MYNVYIVSVSYLSVLSHLLPVRNANEKWLWCWQWQLIEIIIVCTFSDIAMLIENGNDVDTDNGDLNPMWNDNEKWWTCEW